MQLRKDGRNLAVISQANFQLADGFVGSFQRVDAMASEIVRGFRHVFAGAAQGLKSFADFRMRLRRSFGGWSGLRLGRGRCRNGDRNCERSNQR